jgi:hypothetical protein
MLARGLSSAATQTLSCWWQLSTGAVMEINTLFMTTTVLCNSGASNTWCENMARLAQLSFTCRAVF